MRPGYRDRCACRTTSIAEPAAAPRGQVTVDLVLPDLPPRRSPPTRACSPPAAVDPGTKLLLLDGPSPGRRRPPTLLDLGCGYGAHRAHPRPAGSRAPRVWAVDVNERARDAVCERNADAAGLANVRRRRARRRARRASGSTASGRTHRSGSARTRSTSCWPRWLARLAPRRPRRARRAEAPRRRQPRRAGSTRRAIPIDASRLAPRLPHPRGHGGRRASMQSARRHRPEAPAPRVATPHRGPARARCSTACRRPFNVGCDPAHRRGLPRRAPVARGPRAPTPTTRRSARPRSAPSGTSPWTRSSRRGRSRRRGARRRLPRRRHRARRRRRPAARARRHRRLVPRARPRGPRPVRRRARRVRRRRLPPHARQDRLAQRRHRRRDRLYECAAKSGPRRSRPVPLRGSEAEGVDLDAEAAGRAVDRGQRVAAGRPVVGARTSHSSSSGPAPRRPRDGRGGRRTRRPRRRTPTRERGERRTVAARCRRLAARRPHEAARIGAHRSLEHLVARQCGSAPGRARRRPGRRRPGPPAPAAPSPASAAPVPRGEQLVVEVEEDHHARFAQLVQHRLGAHVDVARGGHRAPWLPVTSTTGSLRSASSSSRTRLTPMRRLLELRAPQHGAHDRTCRVPHRGHTSSPSSSCATAASQSLAPGELAAGVAGQQPRPTGAVEHADHRARRPGAHAPAAR